MINKHSLSEQGLKKVEDAATYNRLKKYFADGIISKNDDLVTDGYFIGKTLLRRILLENKDAAGILISFGMDNPIEKEGQIILIVEPAWGKLEDDKPKLKEKSKKYATTDPLGPDGLLPQIKPTPQG
jgi:hypothetical protein